MLPLLLTKTEWNRIVDSADPNREEPETVRRREYLAFLNERSRAMAKDWPNSLENVNKRNEEIRRARIETAERVNERFYKRYVRRKKEEQERMMYSARDTIFKNKDAPKLLLSGVVESVILKEREEQIKFAKEFVGGYEREQQRLEDERIMRNAKEWHELQAQKKRKRFEVNKEHQRELLEQIKVSEEYNRRAFEEEMRLQRQDIIEANKEMEIIKEFEKDFREKERQRIWRDNEQSLKETAQRRWEANARDQMNDQLIQVLTKSQDRIERRRKQMQNELREEKKRLMDKISQGLTNDTDERDRKEQENLEKAVKEQQAAVEERFRADIAKRERQNREKRELHEQYLREEEERLKQQENMRNWELMNRFKNDEFFAVYEEGERQKAIRKKMEFREKILKQKEEVAGRNDKEKAETRFFYGEQTRQKFREADNKLLTHAAALIEEAERNGRPTMPIKKAIDRYCKLYRLYPMPELPRSLQAHFPTYRTTDGSRPDPSYLEPPKPPPGPDPLHELDDDDDEHDEPKDEKRYGLQTVVKGQAKSETPKMKNKDAKAPGDYKRQGPANGLQRKPPDIVLPPITVVTYPCKTIGMVTNVPVKKQECAFLLGQI